MKILILTQPLRTNYGGLLQAYALQKVLRDMGHDVVTDKYGVTYLMRFSYRMLHFTYHSVKKYILGSKVHNPYQFLFTSLNPPIIRPEAKYLDLFIENNINTCDFFKGSNKINHKSFKQLDAIIVGSDQVWRPAYSYVPSYFLDFTKKQSLKRIAYAASFGKDTMDEFVPTLLNKCAAAAPLFDGISVREDTAVDLCKQYLNVEAKHVLDPTLLLNKDIYLSLIEQKDELVLSDVLLSYVLDADTEKSAIINDVAEKLHLTPLELMPKEKWSPQITNVENCVFPSISKWLRGFRDAKFVVTDSFHGTVFAIIFNKPFIAIANKKRGATRFTSLLKIFNLENHLISSIEELSDELLNNIDYSQINSKKTEWQNKSIEFLKTSLS